MAWYTYANRVAFDPNTLDIAPVGSVGHVYAVSDLDFSAPAPTFDLTGIPIELVAGEHGFLPTFQVEDHVELKWVSGEHVFHLNTTTPLFGPTGPAVASARVSGDALTFTRDDGETLPPVILPTGPGGSDEGVAGYVGAEGSATDIALRGRFVSKGELVINVSDYGAQGDGINDDRAAIQSALNMLSARGGGTLHFEPREYWVSEHLTLSSNTIIQGNGATLFKRLATDPSYVIFAALSNGATGYGSSVKNVTVRDLHFKGNYDAPRQACAFALHHAQNVAVENCTFTEMSGIGHVFDLSGCDGVTIRDSTFYGSRQVAGSLYAEAIQVDYSVASGMSVPDAPGSFDGLPSRNIAVDNCKFLPYTKDATTYPCPIPFGSHGAVQGMVPENLKFTNNVIDSPPTDTVSTYRGILHFVGGKNVWIENNVFLNRNGVNISAVKFHATAVGVLLSDVGNVSPSTQPIPAQAASSVSIRGNRFEGFKAQSATEPIVSVYGAVDMHGRVIDISGNVFTDCYTLPVSAGTGPDPILLNRVKGATIQGNHVQTARRLGYFANSSNLKIVGNEVLDTNSNAIFLATVTEVIVEANSIDNYSVAIHASDSQQLRWVGNQVSNSRQGAGSKAVSLTGCTRFIISGNDLSGGGTTETGVTVYGTSTIGAVRNNIITGFTAPTSVAAGSTATVEQNITA